MSHILTTANIPVLPDSQSELAETRRGGYTSTAHTEGCWSYIPKACCVAGGIRTPMQRDYMAFMHAVPRHLGTSIYTYDTVLHVVFHQQTF